MRIHHRRRGGNYQKKEEGVVFRANEAIQVPEVRVIDEEGKPLDVMPTSKALQMARERGYDLVEVSPKAQPPVCRFLDFGQFKYQKEKEARIQKAHAKKVDVKGIRLTARIGQHDLDVRKTQAEGFLAEGHKIRIEIMLRGRDREHADLAMKLVESFIAQVQTKYPLFIEQAVTRSGGTISAIVGRKG